MIQLAGSLQRPLALVLFILCSWPRCLAWESAPPSDSRAEQQSTAASSDQLPTIEQLAEVLSRQLLEPSATLAQVQRFCEARIPEVPEARDAQHWLELTQQWRQRVLDEIVFRGEAQRWRDAVGQVQWLDTLEGFDGYRIRKLRYEALPGLWIPALLYEPTGLSGRVPVSLNVNGHDGAGKAASYKQIRCINQAKRGMLALNVEWLGMGQLNSPGMGHYRMNQLDLCGTSGLAPFYLAMQRGLDLLLAHPHADARRVVVAGLSGGGWQTIILSALDTRVTLANPVAGYSSYRTRARHFSDLGDSEQTPSDLATIVDYTHLTAMMAPRGLLLTKNRTDNCCFASAHALPPLLAAARPAYAQLSAADRLRWHINDDPGDHNFQQDNRQALYRMIRDQFYDGDQRLFPAEEIACDDELQTAEQLQVPLPPDNLDFSQLAAELAKALPRQPELPGTAEEAITWRQQRQEQLRQLLRTAPYECSPRPIDQQQLGSVTVNRWLLGMGGEWTIPVIEFAPRQPQRTKLLFSEQGRSQLAQATERALADNARVLAVDPFYFGESRIEQRDFLFALLVAAVGQRPLGIQAQQLAAVARWAAESSAAAGQSVSLEVYGRRAGLIGLAAAALESGAISELVLHGSFASLRDLIDEGIGVDQAPEMFCFGLLESLDVLQLATLVAPRPVRLVDCPPAVAQAMEPLQALYGSHGKR